MNPALVVADAERHQRAPTAATLELPQRANSILDLIGHTPLVDVTKLGRDLSPRVRLYAKLEGFNPGGSVKDRPALWMVRHGLFKEPFSRLALVIATKG